MGIEDHELPDFMATLKRLGAAPISEISVVPDNIFSATEPAELVQAAESDTLRTLLTQSQIPYQELFNANESIAYHQNYSDDWFGPTILIPVAAFLQNPNIASVILGLITNYLYDAFKGGKTQTVQINIIRETEAGEFRKLSYSGPIEGMTELSNILDKIK